MSNIILQKTSLKEVNIFQSNEKISFDFFYYDKKYFLIAYFLVKRENALDIKNHFFKIVLEKSKSKNFEKEQIKRITDAFNFTEHLINLGAFENLHEKHNLGEYLEKRFLLLKK